MACVKVHGWSIVVGAMHREEQRRHPHDDNTTEEGWR